jgi:hypothetical protein
MRLRRAVPKIPAKSSVPPRLPLHKSRPLSTLSKSTLPQLLIPLHFKSCISNVYKKPQGEGPISTSKVLQLVTTRSPLLRTRRNPCNPFPLMSLLHNLRTPRVGYLPLFSAPPQRTPFTPAGSGRRRSPRTARAVIFFLLAFRLPHSVIPSEAEGSASSPVLRPLTLCPYFLAFPPFTSLLRYFLTSRITSQKSSATSHAICTVAGIQLK